MEMTYFWKKNDSIYHSQLRCSSVPVTVRKDPNWLVSEERPKDKEICRECREKEIAQKIKGKI
jgi:hypothetical protein